MFTTSNSPKFGIAYSPYVPTFVGNYSSMIDYVEVPYELLIHNPAVAEIASTKPIVLHCASLSVAGTVPPSPQTVEAVNYWIRQTGTPWLGEHLSFITAEREQAGPLPEEYAPGEPYNIGYTVSPPSNEETVQHVAHTIERCAKTFNIPILLENSPVYFEVPGSTMSQVKLIREICDRTSVRLLLDLSHFYISSKTLGFDPLQEILSLPLDRVTEVHVSGVDIQQDMYWDNHAARAPNLVLELLALVLSHTHVSAITLEYNWSAQFPISLLVEEIERVRAVAERIH
jgi:uncharacterized protein